ncbi:MAG TPA: TIGR00153 family protein [Longimicrobiales bacterium]|nr:TIGR00153 family protein [Longimicrobiales bacterium]
MRSIVALFGKSPFGSLARHAQRVRETVELIEPLLEAFLAEDRKRTEEIYERISKLEHKADIVKNDIREHLPKSLMMPVDRGDVLTFLKEQDRMADRAEDLAVLLTMRRTRATEAMRKPTLALAEAVKHTADAWFKVAGQLTTLEGASFAGPEVDRIMESIRAISNLEWEADKRQAAASRVMFDHEDEIGAVSVMLWMNIYRVLGSIADHAENTADLLRVMLAKR